ncbi:MAG: amidohydrolase family protein [Vicinamibacterales bacterium]
MAERRHGIVATATVVMATALVAACARPPQFDLLVRGGQVLDGRGTPAVAADIGVNGDRIVAIGDLSAATATTVVDATGRIVSPGFIDVQGQSGTSLLVDGRGESHLRQGITSEIIGEGDSPAFWTAKTAGGEALARAGRAVDWTTYDGYFARLTAGGTAINVGTLVPATLVRSEVVGLENRAPTAEELGRMTAMVEQAMEDGAFGLSSALIYMPGSFASTEELIALARAAASRRGIYVTHIRGESFNLFNALDEALRIGRDGGLPVVIFHLKVGAKANWGRMGDAVKTLADAAAAGQRVSATMYPYAAGGTRLAAVLPLWAQEGGTDAMLARLADPRQRARMRAEVEGTTDGWENLLLAATFDGVQVASVPADYDPSVVGKRLAEIAAARGADPWDVLFEIITATKGRAGALYHMMSEDDVRTGLAAPFVSIGTDSAAIRHEGPLAQGQPHPRAYGTFPRVLGHYVRETRLLTLEEAVRRMTSLAAEQFQIRDRGVIREGAFADLVVFDPATVADTATYERPHAYPRGIDHVIVNGVPALGPTGLTGQRPGRALHGPGRTRP